MQACSVGCVVNGCPHSLTETSSTDQPPNNSQGSHCVAESSAGPKGQKKSRTHHSLSLMPLSSTLVKGHQTPSCPCLPQCSINSKLLAGAAVTVTTSLCLPTSGPLHLLYPLLKCFSPDCHKTSSSISVASSERLSLTAQSKVCPCPTLCCFTLSHFHPHTCHL